MLFLLMMSEIVYPKNLCIVGQSYKYLFTFCQSIPGYKGITHSREKRNDYYNAKHNHQWSGK